MPRAYKPTRVVALVQLYQSIAYKQQVHILFIHLFASFYGQYFTGSIAANSVSGNQLTMLTVFSFSIDKEHTMLTLAAQASLGEVLHRL